MRKKQSRKWGFDTPCKREESLFNAFIDFRRSLNKLDSEFLCKLAALLLCNSPLICPVRLVTNKDLVHTLRRMLLDVSVPCADICVDVRLDKSVR